MAQIDNIRKYASSWVTFRKDFLDIEFRTHIYNIYIYIYIFFFCSDFGVHEAPYYTTYIHSLVIRDTPDTTHATFTQKSWTGQILHLLKKENGTHLLQISHWEDASTIKSYFFFFFWPWVSYKICKENGIPLLQISHSENACTIKTKILLYRFFLL